MVEYSHPQNRKDSDMSNIEDLALMLKVNDSTLEEFLSCLEKIRVSPKRRSCE